MYFLFSHNDLDGVGCGILAKLAFGEQAEVRYNSVSGLDLQVERYLEKKHKEDVLLITDLSVHAENEKKIEAFVKAGGDVILLDHHKTALHLNEYSWGHVKVSYDDGKLTSATSLLYDYFIENKLLNPTPIVEQFVELVRLYDTWEWEGKNELTAKQLNDLFFLLSIDEFEERMVARLQTETQFQFNEFEQKILAMEEEKIGRYVRKKRRELTQTFIHGFCTGIVHAESYHSELGNELGKDSPHLDYIAIINVGGKRISLRTIHDDIDVSEIANRYGGGGHAKASGCSLTTEAYEQYVAKVFPLEPLRIDATRNRYNEKGSTHGCLYVNYEQEQFYLYPTEEEIWAIEKNGEKLDQEYPSFEEAERMIKRTEGASLARDELFIRFLMDNVIHSRLVSLEMIDYIKGEETESEHYLS